MSIRALQLTAEESEQIRRIIGKYLFDLGFGDDMAPELGAELDGPGPDSKQRKHIGYLGERMTTIARILEGAERGRLAIDPGMLDTFADCELQSEQTLDADSGPDIGGHEDPHAVRLASEHLAEVRGICELLRTEPEAVAA